MSRAIKLCTASLIPSLYPFAVLSDLLVSANEYIPCRRLICSPISLAFGTSDNGSFAVLLGLLCGFPIGAKAGLSMYKNKKISRDELRHIMSFCNIPSPAFVCGTLGVLFESSALAVLLYISLILSCIAIGLVGRAVYRYKNIALQGKTVSYSAVSLTLSVSSSCSVMMNICGYVMLFSVIYGYIREGCLLMGVPDVISVIFSGLLEISSGMSCISELGGKYSLWLIGFFAGFSGLSVFFQIISLDGEGAINKRYFLLQKFVQGVICACIFYPLCRILSLDAPVSEQTIRGTLEMRKVFTCVSFFAASVIPLYYCIKNKIRPVV